MSSSPPQSDTVVEVSERMRKLVDQFEKSVIEAAKIHDSHPDSGERMVYFRIDRNALLREIARLEEDAKVSAAINADIRAGYIPGEFSQ